jgi:hypothetical protein
MLLALLLPLLTVIGCAGTAADMGTLVRRDSVRAVKLGMTQAEVQSVIGTPISIERYMSNNGEMTTLTYTRHTIAARFHPMLWVHLREGKVREVYGKRYSLWILDDDIGIYELNVDRRWESPVFEELFPQ